MPKLSLSQAWTETKAVLARDGRLFASVALALVVLPQTIIGLTAPRSALESSALGGALVGIAIVIGFAAQIALNRLAIGPSTTVGAAIGRGFARMPALIGSFAIITVALFILLIPVVLVLGAAGVMTEPGTGHEAPPSVLLLVLAVAALSYAVFQLTVPIAAAEQGGSIHLISRSWRLARHSYGRLLAFVIVVFIGLVIVLVAGQYGLGSIIALTLGPADPLSLSALVVSLVVALIQAGFTVVFAIMLARIYVQLAGAGPQAGVPRSGI
jgi:hypothetical protein